jgi:hypothetical protein
MNKRTSLIATTDLYFSLCACASRPGNNQVGAVTGAVVGSVAGSVLSGDGSVGTVVGAGAAAGHEIGKRMK